MGFVTRGMARESVQCTVLIVLCTSTMYCTVGIGILLHILCTYFLKGRLYYDRFDIQREICWDIKVGRCKKQGCHTQQLSLPGGSLGPGLDLGEIPSFISWKWTFMSKRLLQGQTGTRDLRTILQKPTQRNFAKYLRMSF